MKKKIIATLMLVFILGTVVYAGTTYVDYSTTVAALNGNGYTAYQTKTTTGASARLYSASVGGDYEVDARMIDSSGSAGDWYRNLGDGEWAYIDGSPYQLSGDSVRIQFSNDLTTLVDVQVTGSWKSN